MPGSREMIWEGFKTVSVRKESMKMWFRGFERRGIGTRIGARQGGREISHVGREEWEEVVEGKLVTYLFFLTGGHGTRRIRDWLA